MRSIHEAGAGGHVNGIRTGPIVCAVLCLARQIERGAIRPSIYDGFAGFVFVNLRRGRGPLDFRKGEAVALLHVENCVVTKNKRDAVILARVFFVFLGVFGKLLAKDNRRSAFAFADIAFQRLRLLEGKPERGAVFARPKQKDIDAAIGLAGVEIARERAAKVARCLPRLFPRNHASFEAGNNVFGNGLVDARPAGCIAMVAVCHDVLLSCAARVGRDCEGGLFAFGTQPNFFC